VGCPASRMPQDLTQPTDPLCRRPLGRRNASLGETVAVKVNEVVDILGDQLWIVAQHRPRRGAVTRSIRYVDA
jgi:hypothetical protein